MALILGAADEVRASLARAVRTAGLGAVAGISIIAIVVRAAALHEVAQGKIDKRRGD